ncbi:MULTISPECIES: hypothetical protein [unclassified Micromonospora]|uniref:hypothetical protein n=1 Tax=unclassified Micromonospora TaxID=2617518 RepID=UPI00124B8676|nr:hypothetical protein [Micromonospora sp. AMSO31t]KAB1906161.1 hypothetical protein F8274_25995 [Micromonospora sp. AMSO31t]
MKLTHAPLRLSIGAFILNSGLSKRSLEGEAAAGMHGMAVGAIPQLRQFPPDQFAKLLSRAEIALGAALLIPFVPSLLAGAGLTAFGAGLVQLYLKTPGMREGNSLKPSQAGIGLAKDSWLVAAGLTLMLDSLAHKRRFT